MIQKEHMTIDQIVNLCECGLATGTVHADFTIMYIPYTYEGNRTFKSVRDIDPDNAPRWTSRDFGGSKEWVVI